MWLELVAVCADRRERGWRIEQARGTVAHVGPPVADRLERLADVASGA